ncbi:MAG: hypothetical protein ABSG08_18810 [Terriglobales bacterium]|jgi:hypothetical protein
MRELLATFAVVCLSMGAVRWVIRRSRLDLVLLLPYAEKYANEKRLGIAIFLELALKFAEHLVSQRFSWILESLALAGLLVLAVLGLLYLLGLLRSAILRINFLALLRSVYQERRMKQFVMSIDAQALAEWLRGHYPDYNLPLLIDYVNSEYTSVFTTS